MTDHKSSRRGTMLGGNGILCGVVLVASLVVSAAGSPGSAAEKQRAPSDRENAKPTNEVRNVGWPLKLGFVVVVLAIVGGAALLITRHTRKVANGRGGAVDVENDAHNGDSKPTRKPSGGWNSPQHSLPVSAYPAVHQQSHPAGSGDTAGSTRVTEELDRLRAMCEGLEDRLSVIERDLRVDRAERGHEASDRAVSALQDSRLDTGEGPSPETTAAKPMTKMADLVTTFCRRECDADGLIAGAESRGLRWGAGLDFGKAGQLKFQEQSRAGSFIAFQKEPASSEYLVIAKQNVEWDLSMAAIVSPSNEHGSQPRDGTRVRTTKAGVGRIGEGEVILIAERGAVEPSP